MKEHIYWIGTRRSDIQNEKLFYGSITRYGALDTDNHFSFCNNNHFSLNYNDYLNETLQCVLAKDKKCLFLFANESKAYCFGEEVHNRSLCRNSLCVTQALNDKLFMRSYLNNVVKTLPSVVVPANVTENFNFVKSIFNNQYSEFVVQNNSGAGGIGTILLVESQKVESNNSVLITPFYRESIPINVHIVMQQNTYIVLPPSVQIILNHFTYSGADFIKYQELSHLLQNEVINTCKLIAKKLKELNFYGVLGIDLLIIGESVYFLESNFRYQGSSFLLNMALQQKGFPSLFQMQYDAFYTTNLILPKDIYNTEVNYSFIRRNFENQSLKLPTPNIIIKDSINSCDFSEDKYLYHEIFEQSIYDLL